MKFQHVLIHGILIKRYKRFLADIMLDDGTRITAHCPNSGSMKSCLEPGAEVYLSPVNDPKRKTKFTWEMIKIDNRWVGVNTGIPCQLAYDAIVEGKIPGLENFSTVRREVVFGDSRLDVFAENSQVKCFVEVKNVTLKEGNKALFPDSVTLRGQKHLKTLIEVKKQGMRAVMLYIVQRSDVDCFVPAAAIDPNYAIALRHAVEAGVEVIVVQAQVSPGGIELIRCLPAILL